MRKNHPRRIQIHERFHICFLLRNAKANLIVLREEVLFLAFYRNQATVGRKNSSIHRNDLDDQFFGTFAALPRPFASGPGTGGKPRGFPRSPATLLWQDLPEKYPHPSTCWRRLRVSSSLLNLSVELLNPKELIEYIRQGYSPRASRASRRIPLPICSFQ